MQKGFAQLFVILSVIIVAVVLGFSYLNKSETSQLQVPILNNNSPKIYTNNILGFQFQYLTKDLNLKEDSEEDFNKRDNGDFRKNFKGYVTYEPGKFLGAVVVLDKSGNYDQNPFTVWIFDNPQDLSIDAWYKNYWYYPFVWGDFTYTGKVELAPKMEATISGQVAKSGVIDYQPGKPKFVYVSKDKKMYLFRIIGSDGDKILSTFKFTQ